MDVPIGLQSASHAMSRQPTVSFSILFPHTACSACTSTSEFVSSVRGLMVQVQLTMPTGHDHRPFTFSWSGGSHVSTAILVAFRNCRRYGHSPPPYPLESLGQRLRATMAALATTAAAPVALQQRAACSMRSAQPAATTQHLKPSTFFRAGRKLQASHKYAFWACLSTLGGLSLRSSVPCSECAALRGR